jgi:hypothetical protein
MENKSEKRMLKKKELFETEVKFESERMSRLKATAGAMGLFLALFGMIEGISMGSQPSRKAVLVQKLANQMNPEALFAQYALNIKKYTQIQSKNASQGMSSEFYRSMDQAFDARKMAQVYLKKFEELSLEGDLEAEIAFYETTIGLKVQRVQQQEIKNIPALVEFSKRVAQNGVSATRREFVLQYDEITRGSDTLIHLERSAVTQLCDGLELAGVNPSLIKLIQDQWKMNEANFVRQMKEAIFKVQLFLLDHFSDEEVKELLRIERTGESRRNTMASWKAYGETIQSASLEWWILLGIAEKLGVRLK